MNCSLARGVPRFSAFGGGCREQFGGASLFRSVFGRVLTETAGYKFMSSSGVCVSSARVGTDTGGGGCAGMRMSVRTGRCRRGLRGRVGRSELGRKGDPLYRIGGRRMGGGRGVRDGASGSDNVFFGGRGRGYFTCLTRATYSGGGFVLSFRVASNGVRSDMTFSSLCRGVGGGDGRRAATVTVSTKCVAPCVYGAVLSSNVVPTVPCGEPVAGGKFFGGCRCMCSRCCSYCVYPGGGVLGCSAAGESKCERCGSGPDSYGSYRRLGVYAGDGGGRGLIAERV